MSRVRCFAPVADANATILILGSMPGKESLRAQQYYAHPRNAFWQILGELIGAAPTLAYEQRLHLMRAAGIALWDVLASCARTSSLDSDIDNCTLVSNDFASFFAYHRKIARVFFNGAKAEDCYRKHVLPTLSDTPLAYQRLPSTSPANASLSYKRKLAAWKTVAQK